MRNLHRRFDWNYIGQILWPSQNILTLLKMGSLTYLLYKPSFSIISKQGSENLYIWGQSSVSNICNLNLTCATWNSNLQWTLAKALLNIKISSSKMVVRWIYWRSWLFVFLNLLFDEAVWEKNWIYGHRIEKKNGRKKTRIFTGTCLDLKSWQKEAWT